MVSRMAVIVVVGWRVQLANSDGISGFCEKVCFFGYGHTGSAELMRMFCTDFVWKKGHSR